ncbi:acyl-CoA synthetase [Methylobacterium radiodurans]|uniref:Acyl-CoA synthetase n=2 Tax=Methylobacterium radiodurans TaxID=2202828 RepID=A0A2U8VZ65_9HYPH|nr:acyl-CoA synthetase [Methylobacterium radiodurans]
MAPVTPPGSGLAGLLRATAAAHPARPAFADLGDKPGWSGRPGMTWTYGAAAEIVGRLAHGIRAWRLAPGSRIGLWFAGSSEALVAHLAVEAAGHVPCPMPAAWEEAQVLAAVEAAGIPAVLTQARLGARRPAEILCRVALQHFALRYLAAFGPDVPDGVINLDALALERGSGPAEEAPPARGLVSFAGRDPLRPVYRPGEALLAAVAAHLAAVRIAPGERLLTLLPPDDLRGLATGLGAALVSGATLACMPVLDAAALRAALAAADPRGLHLTAPAFLEAALRELPLDGLRGLTLAHRAPARLTARQLRPVRLNGPRIVDALALDEEALLSRARGTDDIALALADPAGTALPAGLMELRCGADGDLTLRGAACRAGPLRDGAPALPEAGDWRPLPYRATLLAGTATGLVPAVQPVPATQPLPAAHPVPVARPVAA